MTMMIKARTRSITGGIEVGHALGAPNESAHRFRGSRIANRRRGAIIRWSAWLGTPCVCLRLCLASGSIQISQVVVATAPRELKFAGPLADKENHRCQKAESSKNEGENPERLSSLHRNARETDSPKESRPGFDPDSFNPDVLPAATSHDS